MHCQIIPIFINDCHGIAGHFVELILTHVLEKLSQKHPMSYRQPVVITGIQVRILVCTESFVIQVVSQTGYGG